MGIGLGSWVVALASASASASWVVASASASWVVASASASWVVASASASWSCGLVTSLAYTPLDRQPVQFVTDGGGYSAELWNVQNQPRCRVQDRLKTVEEVRTRSMENGVTVVNPTCNERVNECQQRLFG